MVVPGMLGPRASSIYDVFDLFDFAALWQDDRQPIVDYVLGATPKGGVFAVGYTEKDFQQFTLAWFPPEMGPGPYYLFYRPYHLGHIEALKSVVEAVVHKRALLKPDFGFMTNVYAYARRDLRQGETMDGLGGYLSYGMIENQADNVQHPGLPICLSDGVTVCRDIAKDEKIYMDDVHYETDAPRFQLFQKALAVANPETVPM